MLKEYNDLIFEISQPGHVSYDLPENDVPTHDLTKDLPEYLIRQDDAKLPEVSELQLVRHYTALSTKNFGIESGPYPLGSCTMKYNPKVNETIAALDGFSQIHPQQEMETAQGALELLYNLQDHLAEITGMDSISLQPAAGAHGELAAILMFKAFHEANGEGAQRKNIIVPDSAHGTNPATATVAGYESIEIPSTSEGIIDIVALKQVVNEETAGIMLTNPNTAGLYERDIQQIVDIVHEAGGLAYYDGANSNAIMGISNPGTMGFDAVHLNLHKTFTGPHGGGGPGSGPIGVKAFLEPFLPVPRIEKADNLFVINSEYPQSIGRIKGNFGNFGVNVRAYSYIRTMGAKGLTQVSKDAVLNSNYLKERIKNYYDVPFAQHCMHEFVVSCKQQKTQYNVNAKDVGKRLLDYGIHSPTTYFPLIVEECLMIEPTETESIRELDQIADAFINIAKEIMEDPEKVKQAPYLTSVRRLDETTAARKPILTYQASLQN